MPNKRRLYEIDEEANKILESIPTGQRSKFVRDAVKLKFEVDTYVQNGNHYIILDFLGDGNSKESDKLPKVGVELG